ncbi:hypothetical protein ZWY2020_001958 [Hordeum vulgare]|nr:hypothetical protein ZWY2020_001958 [Hordeum vulgare]
MRRGVGARLLPQAAAIAVAVAVACCMAGAAAQGTTMPVDAGGAVPSCASKLVTPSAWRRAGVLLAKRCGVTTDASTCAKYAAGAGADAATAGSTAASSASTGTAASTVAKPTASGGSTHPLSLMAASSFVGLSFIWWTIMA